MADLDIKTVLVIGGSGNLGPSILNALEGDSNFEVSILTRQSSTSTFPPGCKILTVDDSYPESQLRDAFKNQDAIICALSLQNIPQQNKFIDAAVSAGVKWFVPAEFGNNKDGSKSGPGETISLHGAKDLVLQNLRKAESSGLSWTAVATGPFIDWGIENGFLGFNIKAREAKIYGSGDDVWTGTTLSDIGLAVARLLRKPAEVRNKFIYVYSVRTTQNEILAALESQTSSKWAVQRVKWEEEIAIGREKLKNGDRSGVLPLILSSFFQAGMGGDYANDVEAANSILGLSTQNVRDVVQSIIP